MSNEQEQATADQIKDLLAQLTTAQNDFDEWRKTQPVIFDKEMRHGFLFVTGSGSITQMRLRHGKGKNLGSLRGQRSSRLADGSPNWK
jgi:hypothetical protein